MPNLGYETIGVTPRAINSVGRGSAFTMTEDGTLQSVTAYIEDGAVGDTFVACVYNGNTLTSATLVETSATRTNISTAGWYTFTCAGSTALTNGTVYAIMVGSNSAAGANVYYDAGTGYGISSFDPTNPPASTDLEALVDARLYSTYLTYTAGGGGGGGTPGHGRGRELSAMGWGLSLGKTFSR